MDIRTTLTKKVSLYKNIFYLWGKKKNKIVRTYTHQLWVSKLYYKLVNHIQFDFLFHFSYSLN